MAFQGSLAELHLPDIIQLISVSGKTGVFHLTDGRQKGEIYLNEGRIVHAELEDATGEEAVYALAIWRQGEFRFDPGVPTDRLTITKSNTNLLMEAARRLDEWRVLSKKIPSTDLVPEFVMQETREGQINLNTSEWLILSKIDGQRSVKGIAAASGLSVFDAAKMLYGLVAANLIRLKDPAGGPTPPPARTVPPRPPGVTPSPTPTSPGLSGPPDASRVNDLMARLSLVRDASSAVLGPVGETVVAKHYVRARGDIEKGAGQEAIEEAVQQIVRAASILKGPSVADSLLEQIKTLK
jgi:Domain of unknown function (DUF4388)